MTTIGVMIEEVLMGLVMTELMKGVPMIAARRANVEVKRFEHKATAEVTVVGAMAEVVIEATAETTVEGMVAAVATAVQATRGGSVVTDLTRGGSTEVPMNEDAREDSKTNAT
jgi:uncharacterized membrane protein